MLIDNVRLIDVFFTGPLQIIVSTYVKYTGLKLFMLITGILNILYNLHNYLLIDRKILKEPVFFFRPFVDLRDGKTQPHRLYNLIVMYPIFLYVFLTTDLPTVVKIIFAMNILVGVVFNFYFFNKLIFTF